MAIEHDLDFYRHHGSVCGVALRLFVGLFISITSVAHAEQPPPYAVGSETVFVHDDSRGLDPVAGVDAGIRVLITEIWYPVDRERVAGAVSPTWGDYAFRDPQVHRRMMLETTFLHLSPMTVREGVSSQRVDEAVTELFARRRDSYRGLPPAAGNSRFPVLVMSHGDAGSRYNMSTTSQWLASHGFLVIAPDHTGNSPYAMIGRDPALQTDPVFRQKMAPVLPLLDDRGVYGHDKPFGQSYAPPLGIEPDAAVMMQLDHALSDRVEDLRAVLTQLEKMNQTGPFAGRIDLERIGLMGRSFGGATTMIALQQEARFKAGFAVVPAILPGLRNLVPDGARASIPANSPLLAEEGSAFFGHQKPLMLLGGAQDDLIITLEAALAEFAGTPPPSAANRQPMLRAAFESGQGYAAYGMLDRTNHGSLGVAGNYWWPELRQDEFPDPLLPGEAYTLMPVKDAHRVQAELALHFFKAHLLGDTDALEWLNSPVAPAGLSWEVRKEKAPPIEH